MRLSGLSKDTQLAIEQDLGPGTRPSAHAQEVVPLFLFFLATSLGMWDLVLRPGVEHMPLALEVWSLNKCPFVILPCGSPGEVPRGGSS